MTLVLAASCDSGGSSGGTPSKLGDLGKKIEAAGNKVGGALDKIDQGEARDKLAAAKASVASGGVAADECTWVANQAASTDPSVVELRQVCAVGVAVNLAKPAVAKAEEARKYQAKGMISECTSDDYAKAAASVEAYKTDPAWADVAARWAKACP